MPVPAPVPPLLQNPIPAVIPPRGRGQGGARGRYQYPPPAVSYHFGHIFLHIYQ